jgi:glycosyltransferase involved in cell wall biosynthesis
MSPASASIVIPAHNEAGVIDRLLTDLLHGARPDEFEVVVACNGCTDDTAAIARRPGVTVVELRESSKIAALNAGDRAVTTFPRVYLDADVSVSLEALRAVVAVLEDSTVAAAPRPVVDTTGCGWISRSYFAIWSRLGYANHGALGSGCYALSATGRARFGDFPDLIADDGFVYTLFGTPERINPPDATFRISAPRTATALFRRRIRISAGNLELVARTGQTPQPPGPDWKAVAQADRRLWPAATVYAGVNAAAKLAARRRARAGTSGNWHQDRSSREATP